MEVDDGKWSECRGVGFYCLLNYNGGAFSFVRREYAGRSGFRGSKPSETGGLRFVEAWRSKLTVWFVLCVPAVFVCVCLEKSWGLW